MQATEFNNFETTINTDITYKILSIPKWVISRFLVIGNFALKEILYALLSVWYKLYNSVFYSKCHTNLGEKLCKNTWSHLIFTGDVVERGMQDHAGSKLILRKQDLTWIIAQTKLCDPFNLEYGYPLRNTNAILAFRSNPVCVLNAKNAFEVYLNAFSNLKATSWMHFEGVSCIMLALWMQDIAVEGILCIQ